MNTKPTFYIVSAALAGDAERAVLDRTDTLAAQLEALGFATRIVEGCYRGEREPAILAVKTVDDGSAERDVLRLGRQYGQESILAVDSNRHASLVFCETEEREPLGLFREVSERVAKHERDAYTHYAGRYFVAGHAAA